MRIPRPTLDEWAELLAAVTLPLLVFLVLPWYRAVPVAVGVPALWLWYCTRRRKWRSGVEIPPTWETHRDHLRAEFGVWAGGNVLLTIACGIPWGTPIGSGLTLTVLVWSWNRRSHAITEARTAWFKDRERAEEKPRDRRGMVHGVLVDLPPAASSGEPGARPSHGTLTRHATGEVVEIRWIETSDPGVFIPVTVDGEPVVHEPGIRVTADKVGQGQKLRIPARQDLPPTE